MNVRMLRVVRAVAVCAAAVMVAAVVTVNLVPVLMGGTSLTVVAGSMRPAINPGDSITVVPADDTIEVGDVVVFPSMGGVMVVHRVVEANPDGELVTQGDANPSPDSPLNVDEVAWVVKYVIPLGGLAAPWSGSTTYALVAGASVVIVAGLYVASAALLEHQRRLHSGSQLVSVSSDR